ncbi:MarR family winged helix-turn-helix transcriptional regulator [Saccharopolyspora flava]|uniref:DNA-binding transcriptional regulator, MarR family n=1 Tax=Saccharopolyspora flava TaxID=95161 RepID=A0A1I6PHR3_9PSEU|nr:MarR family transcriptional regulator [Saccharopolyspora flava]SFS39595.1 DNA-binding transcriptional regulator, MarR family [Saccharopolyspora flava]
MTTEPGTTLDRLLCFALHSASRAFTNLYRPFLDEIGLTYPQYLVMLVLWERESLTVKELGALLRLDSGTLSPLLKRLEARGVLTRARSETDERSVRVAITDDGRALGRHASDIPQRMVAATGMELGDVEELRSTLENLTTTLNDAARRVTENQETPS